MTLHTRRDRADQFLSDVHAAMRVDTHELIRDRARALATIRALWASRRKWRAAAAELEAERDRLRTQLADKLADHRGSSTRMGIEYKNPTRRGYDVALTEVLALLGVDATERDRSAEPAPVVDSETELGLLLTQKHAEGGAQ